jgi:soluble lytic murein transglycosylase
MIGGRVCLSLVVAGGLCWAAASHERVYRVLAPRARAIVARLEPIAHAPAPAASAPIAAGAAAISPAAPVPANPEPVAADPAPDRGPDLSGLIAAAALYQKGDAAGGDALAHALADPLQRTALEWVALKSSPRTDYARLATFGAAHPDWPANSWIRYRQEAALYNDRDRPQIAAALLAANPPLSPAGKLALARIARASGRLEEAATLVRDIWRDADFDNWTERAVLSEFSALLSAADHRYRAERLLYQEKTAPALRAAALAGADVLARATAWAGAISRPLTDAAWDALPAAMKRDPGLIYVRVQTLRRADRVLEAALLILGAPRSDAWIDGDRWWEERRMVARRLLDGGLVREAYALCAEHAAVSIPSRVDAEFHAGWIALRFMGDVRAAARHFAEAAAVAQTPMAIARTAYWQGRAAEQAEHSD